MCPSCRKKEVSVKTLASYELDCKRDGTVHRIVVPSLRALVCGACGEMLFNNDSDCQIEAALQFHLKRRANG